MKPRTISVAEALPRRKTLQEVEVFPGTRARLLADPLVVGKGKGSWAAYGSRRRRLVAGMVTMLAILLAGLVGVHFGSGLYSVEGRFGAQRLEAQSGQTNLRGLPEVPGHPGARASFHRMDVVRQIMALDGVQ